MTVSNRWPWLAAIVMALTGCTVINVDGPARISTVRLGVLRIEPVQPRTLVYRSLGIGLVPGRGGPTLGYRRDTVALVYAADDCRIILFEPRRRDAADLRTILAPVIPAPGDLCTLGGEK